MQSTLSDQDVSYTLPEMYIKPCLEMIHGATTRLDELCSTILNFLRRNCVADELVQIQGSDGKEHNAIVKSAVPGSAFTLPRHQHLSNMLVP
jgi:hypothetical protein